MTYALSRIPSTFNMPVVERCIDEPEELVCSRCGNEIMPDSEQTVNDRIYCDTCYDEVIRACRGCHTLVNISDDDVVHHRRGYYCPTCADEMLVECSGDCGNMLLPEERCENNAGDVFCSDCYSERYTNCSRCECEVERDEIHSTRRHGYLCPNCYDEIGRNEDAIHEHGYSPDELIFHATDEERLAHINKHVGWELEVGTGPREGRYARQCLDIMNHGEHESRIYIQDDGSLEENGEDVGFEVTSQPATIASLMNEERWPIKKMMAYLRHEGYSGHNCGYAGLHFHVNNEWLAPGFRTSTEAVDQLVEMRMRLIDFVDRFYDELTRFARRQPDKIEEWAANYSRDKRNMRIGRDSWREWVKRPRDHFGRYHGVNITNTNTTEIRLFRSTLNYDTFMATAQFVECMVDWCMAHDLEQIAAVTWTEFVHDITGKYAQLDAYLNKRGLSCVCA